MAQFFAIPCFHGWLMNKLLLDLVQNTLPLVFPQQMQVVKGILSNVNGVHASQVNGLSLIAVFYHIQVLSHVYANAYSVPATS